MVRKWVRAQTFLPGASVSLPEGLNKTPQKTLSSLSWLSDSPAIESRESRNDSEKTLIVECQVGFNNGSRRPLDCGAAPLFGLDLFIITNALLSHHSHPYRDFCS